MLVDSPEAFVAALARLATGSPIPSVPALPREVLMIAPCAEFGIEAESARDNRYMQPGAAVDPARAAAQHRALVAAIRRVGVKVRVLDGRDDQKDGVFPNNVFGTAPGPPGHFVIGSMLHPARRREAQREDVRALFERDFGYATIDLSKERCIAELTGPLVIDRVKGIGYCGMSGRVDDVGSALMHEAFALRLTWRFALVAGEYHTNVVLAILASRAAVLWPGAFVDRAAAAAFEKVYSGATIELSAEEKAAYAGNCIALTERDVFLSATAERALRPQTRARFAALGFTLHPVEVDEIEKAGGSVRCMVAEVF